MGLKSGELLPADSKLVILQDGKNYEILLRELIEPFSNGSFYMKIRD